MPSEIYAITELTRKSDWTGRAGSMVADRHGFEADDVWLCE
jgi:hypothetical protein